ncbi:MAG: F0F1 ATP synthase subunit B [Hyphomicrobiaceae bacterium]|nr:F0F1 ATP synthase subunit B [Hyphomicrobiaceae bacterium]
MLAAANAGLFADPKFWVGAAFVIFVLLLMVKGVPSLIAQALDDRSNAIRSELDKAKRLREDAENLLADYQRKCKDVEVEVNRILERAKSEADALQADAHRKLQESIMRRTRIVEEKISSAEKKALSEVRSSAIDRAVSASTHIFKGKLKGDKSSKLLDQSIYGLRDKIV